MVHSNGKIHPSVMSIDEQKLQKHPMRVKYLSNPGYHTQGKISREGYMEQSIMPAVWSS